MFQPIKPKHKHKQGTQIKLVLICPMDPLVSMDTVILCTVESLLTESLREMASLMPNQNSTKWMLQKYIKKLFITLWQNSFFTYVIKETSFTPIYNYKTTI
jgi:hypothetical protein